MDTHLKVALATGKDATVLLTLPSSFAVLSSSPVNGPNPAPTWRRLAHLRVTPAELDGQADVDESGSDVALTSMEKKELAELRRDERQLEMEVEILKRAAAYFARENFVQVRMASSFSECAVTRVASRSIMTCPSWTGAPVYCHTRSRATARAALIAATAALPSLAQGPDQP